MHGETRQGGGPHPIFPSPPLERKVLGIPCPHGAQPADFFPVLFPASPQPPITGAELGRGGLCASGEWGVRGPHIVGKEAAAEGTQLGSKNHLMGCVFLPTLLSHFPHPPLCWLRGHLSAKWPPPKGWYVSSVSGGPRQVTQRPQRRVSREFVAFVTFFCKGVVFSEVIL